MTSPESTPEVSHRTYRRYSMANRKALLFSAVLVIAGEVVYQVAQQFHPCEQVVCNNYTAVFTVYATSTYWALIHAVQFTGNAMLVFGLVALFYALNVTSGVVGVVNRFAAASAVAALAFFAAVYAVDGVALKQAVDAWVSAPASQKSTYFAVAQGIRGLEWGVRGYSDFLTGLSLVLLATVIVWTARIYRPIGYIMGLSGLTYLVQGYGYGTAYTSISNFPFLLASTDYQFLMIVWSIWLLIVAWRMKESVQGAPA
jgi:hypothetical protein